YQSAVDFFFGHQGMGVLRFDRAAIEDAEFVGELLAEGFGGFGSDDGVRVGGHLRSCSLSGADGPDRLVGDYQADGFLGRNFVKGAETLAPQHVVREAGFAFFEDFSHADNGDESSFDGGLELEVDGVIGLAEVLAAFGVSDDDVGDADGEQHGGVDLAGEGAFLLPVKILRADRDVRSLGGGDSGVNTEVGGADD